MNACEAVLPHAFKMAFLYSIHLLFMETPEVDRHSHLTQKKKTQAQRPEPPAWTHTGGTRIQRHQRPLAAPFHDGTLPPALRPQAMGQHSWGGRIFNSRVSVSLLQPEQTLNPRWGMREGASCTPGGIQPFKETPQ